MPNKEDERVRSTDRAYQIESWGNGAFVQLTRGSDGATVFLQGADAERLCDELELTSNRVSDDDLASEYFDE